MASVNLAVILSVISLLLLSAAAYLPHTADDEGTSVALHLDAPKDAEPMEVFIPLVDKTKVDRVDLSLVRPFHRHRPHCHHGHRSRDRRVVPHGDDMISEPKHDEWSSSFEAAMDVVVPEEGKRGMMADEKDGGCRIRTNEHKKNKKTEEEEEDSSDSDSDSDSDSSDSDSSDSSDSDSDCDDERMEMGKRKMKGKGKKEKGGWLKSFLPFHRHRPHCHYGHRLRDRRVVPHGDDMISEPKHGEWSSSFEAATDVVVPEEGKRGMMADEKDGGRRIRTNEHKKNKKTEEEDSDSDCDDERMEMGKRKMKGKGKGKKEKGGWLKSFWVLWD